MKEWTKEKSIAKITMMDRSRRNQVIGEETLLTAVANSARAVWERL